MPAKKSIKDFITDLGRKLNFTNSSYRDVNGLFVEALPNQRYHLFIYTRNNDIHQQLRQAAKPTSDQNYLSLEMNKMNNLFILPPFSNTIYRVQALNQQHELHEKVIEFTTGARTNILDILNLIDCKKYRINYIVCNREKSFVCFRDGIDAIEGVDILRRQNIFASFANCYAHLDDEGNNSCHPLVARRNIMPPQPAIVGVNSNPQFNVPLNNLNNVVNRNIQQDARMNARSYIMNNRNDGQMDARNFLRNRSGTNGRGRGYNRSQPYRRRNYIQHVQRNPPHAIRVPMPHANAGQQEYEWILVRK